MKAIVMEKKQGMCVVLKKDGTFARCPDRGYAVGQQIVLYSGGTARMLAAACLLLCCVSALAGYRIYRTPVGYVYLDINPSVRIEVNCLNKVIGVVPLNEDAERLLAAYSVKKNGVDRCVGSIVDICRQENYINENNTDVEITVHGGGTYLDTQVRQISAAMEQEQLQVSVMSIDEGQNESALQHDISAKRLHAVEDYTDQFGGTVETNVEKLENASTNEIFEAVRAEQMPQTNAEQPSAPEPREQESEAPAEEPTPTEQEPATTEQAPQQPHAAEEPPLPQQEGQTQQPASGESTEVRHVSAKRLRAIEDYTAFFGGTLEENTQLLRGMATEDIFEEIRSHRRSTKGKDLDAERTEPLHPTGKKRPQKDRSE